jgi:hypothetical protein
MRRVRGVAVDHPVAMIHGADECLLPALLAFAPSAAAAAVVHRSVRAAITAIAVLGSKAALAGDLAFAAFLGGWVWGELAPGLRLACPLA